MAFKKTGGDSKSGSLGVVPSKSGENLPTDAEKTKLLELVREAEKTPQVWEIHDHTITPASK